MPETDKIDPYYVNKAIVERRSFGFGGVHNLDALALALLFTLMLTLDSLFYQECPRKEITLPAVRNTKLAIAPNRPGRMEPTFSPSVFRPFPTTLVTDFSPLVRELSTALIVVPTATTTAITVKPYFSNISLILFFKGRPLDSQRLFSHSFPCSLL